MADQDRLNTDFARSHADTFARILGRGDVAEIAKVLETLPPDVAASVVSRLPPSRVAALIASGQQAEARWLADAPLNDAKTLLSRLPRESSLPLVNSIPDRQRRRKLLQYLNYPAHSVGALVTEMPLRFASDMPTADVLAELRSLRADYPGFVAIVRTDGRYLGTLDIWALLTSDALGGTIRDFVVATPRLHAETSLSSAIHDEDWQSNSWLPVVDHEQHLLGGVSRQAAYAAIDQANESERKSNDLFTTLTNDVFMLFAALLDRLLSKKSTS